MSQKARPRIAVVTDSAADIPPDLTREYEVSIEPLILIMGSETWRDGVDIDAAAFYKLLRDSSTFPTTSQPTVASFIERFSDASQDKDGVVAVLVSDELSGTLDSARAAAEKLPDIPIALVDSRAASMQLGFTVLAAARAAMEGAGLEEVAAEARALVGRTHVYFVVDTLEYLHRGGRIGAAARLFGSALNLKPILEVRDGIVTPLGRVRTRQKALNTLLNLLAEQLSPGDRIHMSVLHVAAPAEAASLAQELEERFHPVEMIESECGPVIGAHVGPGTLGVAFYVE
jgi:DegV family protein with EDD domain